GWPIPSPPATMFAWAPIPEVFSHLGSLEFSKLMLEHAGVAVSPGVGFGEYGEGFVRIALVENEQRIRQAARNIRKFLSEAERDLHNVIPLASKANRTLLSHPMTDTLKLGLAGLGTVGGGTLRLLAARGDELTARAGRNLEVVAVSARDHKKRRDAD